jgi:hypothetical protein
VAPSLFSPCQARLPLVPAEPALASPLGSKPVAFPDVCLLARMVRCACRQEAKRRRALGPRVTSVQTYFRHRWRRWHPSALVRRCAHRCSDTTRVLAPVAPHGACTRRPWCSHELGSRRSSLRQPSQLALIPASPHSLRANYSQGPRQKVCAGLPCTDLGIWRPRGRSNVRLPGLSVCLSV